MSTNEVFLGGLPFFFPPRLALLKTPRPPQFLAPCCPRSNEPPRCSHALIPPYSETRSL